jgi:hypothetical protein
MDGARINAVAGKAIEHALAEVISPHAADKTGRAPQARNTVNVDTCITAGERANKGAGAIHGLIEPGTHDFDEHGANADDIRAGGHGDFPEDMDDC